MSFTGLSTNRGNATGDSDYDILQNFQLRFAPFETSKTFDVNILDDEEEELDEIFFVEIKSVTHGYVSLMKETKVVITGDQSDQLHNTGKNRSSFHQHIGLQVGLACNSLCWYKFYTNSFLMFSTALSPTTIIGIVSGGFVLILTVTISGCVMVYRKSGRSEQQPLNSELRTAAGRLMYLPE